MYKVSILYLLFQLAVLGVRGEVDGAEVGSNSGQA